MVIYFYVAGKCQGYPNVLLLPLTSVLQLVVSLKTLKSSSAPSEGCRVKTGCGSLFPSFSSGIHPIMVSAHPAGIDCSRKSPDFRNFQAETDSHLLSTAPCSLATGERAMRFRRSESPSLSIEEVKRGYPYGNCRDLGHHPRLQKALVIPTTPRLMWIHS